MNNTIPHSVRLVNPFLCARRKLGFNKKICRKSLIVYVYYYQPNSCTMMYHTLAAKRGWAGEAFLRQRGKKFL
jgi:hypothetical protein